MPNDTTDHTDTDTDADADAGRRSLDLRSDEQEQADDELQAMLAAYKRQQDIDADEPADEHLRDLADQIQMSDDHTDTDADPETETETDADDGFAPETDPTGETTVTLGDEVPADEADFGPDADPDPDLVEQVATDKDKAKRRAELAEDGHLPEAARDDPDPDPTEDDGYGNDGYGEEEYGGTPAEEAASGDDIDAEDRYGIDISDEQETAHAGEQGAQPDVDVDPAPEPSEPTLSEEEALADMEAAEAEGFEDVLEDGLFDAVDDVDEDFDFESQNVEDASDRKGDKVIELNSVYFKLVQPEGDRFYNMLDQAQTADDIEDRHNLLIHHVVERPYNAVERVDGWSGAARAQLATECAIHSGLHEMQDFQ